MTILQKIEKIVNDMLVLEVATFTKKDATADVSLSAPFGADGGTSSDEVFTEIRKQLKDEELVGYTRFEVDGDTIAFINNDPKYSDIIDYHKEMITAGQETRKNIFETAVGLFKNS